MGRADEGGRRRPSPVLVSVQRRPRRDQLTLPRARASAPATQARKRSHNASISEHRNAFSTGEHAAKGTNVRRTSSSSPPEDEAQASNASASKRLIPSPPGASST